VFTLSLIIQMRPMKHLKLGGGGNLITVKLIIVVTLIILVVQAETNVEFRQACIKWEGASRDQIRYYVHTSCNITVT